VDRRSKPVDRARLAAALLGLALVAPPWGLALVALPAAAEIYQWVDADGQLHFTTDLSQVPAKQRIRSEQGARERQESDRVQRHSGDASPPPARRAPARAARGASQETYTIPVEPGATSLRVMVELNDRVSAPFIIDTGASDVTIPRGVANELGLQTGPDSVTMQYRTANGIIEAPVVTLDAVSLGGARVENVPASVSDSLAIGLLGLTYFNHFHYQIDAARGLVHLTPNGLAESGLVPGGRGEAQWRLAFRNLRSRIEAVQEQIEGTPDSRSRKIEGLEGQRRGLLDQLARLEAEADQAHVPFEWRE
jgi:clan AA aspartic protease (TIGR02281 family)